MYFDTGADSLRGILSPWAYYLRGGLSPGHIVLEAYCLGAGCLRGRLSPGHIVFRGGLSPGRIISGQIVLGHIVSGQHVPQPKEIYFLAVDFFYQIPASWNLFQISVYACKTSFLLLPK